MRDHVGRDHEPDVLAVGDRLHGNPDEFSFLDHRPAAVARIDRRVDLHAQKALAALSVGNDLNARHNTLGDRKLVASQRKPDH